MVFMGWLIDNSDTNDASGDFMGKLFHLDQDQILADNQDDISYDNRNCADWLNL